MGWRHKRAATFEVPAPSKGVIKDISGQLLPDQAWTDAFHIGFSDGKAFRWPGHNPIGLSKVIAVQGDVIAPVPALSSILNATDIVNITSLIPIPGGYPNQILLGLVHANNSLPVETDKFILHDRPDWFASSYNIEVQGNHLSGQIVAGEYYHIFYAVGNFTGNYVTWQAPNPAHGFTLMHSLVVLSGVHQQTPIRLVTAKQNAGAPYNTTDPWEIDGRYVVSLQRANIGNITGVVAKVPATVNIASFVSGPTTYGRVDYRGPVVLADAMLGDGIEYTGTNTEESLQVVLNRNNDQYYHPLGWPGAEPVLEIYDYVKDPTNRFCIVVTSKHVYYYDSTEDLFFVISQEDGVVNYITGTVDTASDVVTGTGTAFVTAAIAPFDMILITGDTRWRCIREINSETELKLTATIDPLAGAAYAIKRPKNTYSFSDRPEVFSFLGKLYIVSLAVDMVEWDGTSVLMTPTAAAGATPIPKAKTVAIVGERPVFGYTDPGSGTEEPQVLRWPDIGTVNDFDGPEAGFMAISDTKEEIVRNLKLDDYGVIYCKDSVHLIQYVGLPFVYTRRQITVDIGALGKGYVTGLEDMHFFVSANGFYKLTTSGGLQPIGHQIRESFFKELDRVNAHKGYSVINKETEEWIISYPTVTGGGTPDKLLIYNYRDDNWTYGESRGYTAMGQVNLVAAAAAHGDELDIPADEYTLRYDELSQQQFKYSVLMGSEGEDAGEYKLRKLEYAERFRSFVEKEGIRFKGENIDTDEAIKVVRIWFNIERPSAIGTLLITLGAKMHETQDYRMQTKEYSMDNGGRGYIDFHMVGKIFKLRIETRDDEETNYGLIHYKLGGQAVGNR